MRQRSLQVATGTMLALACVASRGAMAAGPFPARAERLLSPGRSAASEDSGEALVLNPANLGNLSAPELRWTGVRCPDTAHVACGHSLDLSTPLLFGLGTGLRADLVMAPDGAKGAPYPFNGGRFAWLTWGLGFKVSSRLSVGASVQWSYSSDYATDSLVGVSVGTSYRPNPYLAFSLALHDFNRGSSPSTLGASILDNSYLAAVAFRPMGTRAFEVGAEVRYFEGTDSTRPRGTLAFDIPGVGRARGDIEVDRLDKLSQTSVIGTAGLELALGGVTAGGGALFGNGLGGDNVGEYLTASLSSARTPGLPNRTHAVWMRIEKTPGARSHVHLLKRLWDLAERNDIAAVTLAVRAEPAGSYAHAEELADAIRVLRARGKKVICSFEDAGPKALYACASADRIVVNPAGGLRYAGMKATYLYIASLIEKIGIKADFVRIGAHKSAPEMFTNERGSDVAREDQRDLLRQNEAVFVRNLATYRHLSEEQVRAATLKGPFTAPEARAFHLVDSFAFDDELEKVTREVVGSRVPYVRYEDERKVPNRFGVQGKVGLLYVDGDIVDGRSQTIPLLGTRLVGSYTIGDAIERFKKDSSVKAVVLRIESPGGSSMASDVMWRELKKLGEKKPLIVSMGSVAASGGYYIAAPARTIYALPLTVTGSIGIFYGKADTSELLRRIGVNVEVQKTTPNADLDSMFRGFTDDERAELQRKIGQFYDVFLSRVAEGRHMSKADVDAVGQGRVWAGQQAVTRGLVDKMGGIREALEAARAAGGLPADAPVQEAPLEEKSLFERMLQFAGVPSLMSIEGLPVTVRDAARAVAPLAVMKAETPMARMEWVPFEPGATDDDIDEE